MFIWVGTDAEGEIHSFPTRRSSDLGTATTSSGTATALPVSDDAWNASVVLAARAPGFGRERKRTKPSRRATSAERNGVAAPGAPITSVPPFTTVPSAGSAEK